MPKSRSAAPAVPPSPPAPRSVRIALAMGVATLTAATIASALHPSARNWGLHAAGFLPPPTRMALLALLLVACALVVYGLFAKRSANAVGAARGRRVDWKARWPWLLVAAWIAFGASYPVKEALLGDSAIWIQGVQTDSVKLASEPLSARVLDGVADKVVAAGGTVGQGSLGVVSRVAAIPASLLLAGIAMELGGAAWGVPLALLLTLGASQFYFGYVESYPIAALFVLLFLWLGLRALRGASPVALAGVALGVAGSAHVSALLLFPGYLYLVLRTPWPVLRRILHAFLPVAVLTAMFVALRFDLRNLLRPFQVATQGLHAGSTAETFLRPYAFLSWGHAADILNAALLAAPVACVLLVVACIALRYRPGALEPPLAFVGIGALGGTAATLVLMTSVAPAQDWDLFAFLLLPMAVASIAAIGSVTPQFLRGATGAGLALLSLCLLLAFALVNADSQASIRRFAMVVNDDGRVSPFGRAYGNEMLWVLHRDRGQQEQALAAAIAAFQAEPTNPRYAVNVGHSLLALRRVPEAVPYFQGATAAAPDRWDAPYNLGLCYASMGRQPEALAVFGDVARRSPDHPEVWHAIVRSLVRTGREDSAAVVWERVKSRWPEYVETERKKRIGR